MPRRGRLQSSCGSCRPLVHSPDSAAPWSTKVSLGDLVMFICNALTFSLVRQSQLTFLFWWPKMNSQTFSLGSWQSMKYWDLQPCLIVLRQNYNAFNIIHENIVCFKLYWSHVFLLQVDEFKELYWWQLYTAPYIRDLNHCHYRGHLGSTS